MAIMMPQAGSSRESTEIRTLDRPGALPPVLGGSMMNRMGFSETIFLFLLALLIFGPKKLPEIARQVGKALNEFKRASNEFKAQIESEISQLERDNQRQILPPSDPPKGAVAASPVVVEAGAPPELNPQPDPLQVESEAHSESNSLVKAPNA
jgi:TatA/E family protein of Tat protein translocase